MQISTIKDVLANDLRPTSPLASPLRIALRLGSLMLLTAVAACWLLELRLPLADLLAPPLFLADSLILIVLIFLGLLTLLRLSIPGLTDGTRELGALLTLGILVIARLTFFPQGIPDALPADHPGYTCAFPVILMSAIFGPATILLARSLAPFRTRITAFLAFLTAGLLGTLILQWVCPGSELFHIVCWHYLPVLGIASLATSLSSRFFSR